MNIISFAWTTPAIVACHKTRTRRQWSKDYAQKFKGGSACQAYDKGPRVGGKLIHIIRILKDPWIQNTSEMTEDDFEAEGFQYMQDQGFKLKGQDLREFFEAWKAAAEDLYVVDFTYVWDMAFDEGCAYREGHLHAIACGVPDEPEKLPRPLGQMCYECRKSCARKVQNLCRIGVK
ncbi:MAG: hypothetical protein PHO67_07805 [Candidatus Omnitrophica bacterium]|nr:hypothetical protein [Candidatus Omnitrophota bacterium]